MRLIDTVYSLGGEAMQVGDLMSRLPKPAVIFTYFPLCSSCLNELLQVTSVADKKGIPVWLLVIADSQVAWQPDSVMSRLSHLPPFRLPPPTAAIWGVKETPAVIQIELGTVVSFFEQGTLAPIQFKAVHWTDSSTTTSLR